MKISKFWWNCWMIFSLRSYSWYPSIKWHHTCLVTSHYPSQCWHNWPNSQIPECTCSISHNAPFRTEMCTFLFWMEHCGIWNRCILGFVKLVYSLTSIHSSPNKQLVGQHIEDHLEVLMHQTVVSPLLTRLGYHSLALRLSCMIFHQFFCLESPCRTL